jgi:hypothetical protein
VEKARTDQSKKKRDGSSSLLGCLWRGSAQVLGNYDDVVDIYVTIMVEIIEESESVRRTAGWLIG